MTSENGIPQGGKIPLVASTLVECDCAIGSGERELVKTINNKHSSARGNHAVRSFNATGRKTTGKGGDQPKPAVMETGRIACGSNQNKTQTITMKSVFQNFIPQGGKIHTVVSHTGVRLGQGSGGPKNTVGRACQKCPVKRGDRPLRLRGGSDVPENPKGNEYRTPSKPILRDRADSLPSGKRRKRPRKSETPEKNDLTAKTSSLDAVEKKVAGEMLQLSGAMQAMDVFIREHADVHKGVKEAFARIIKHEVHLQTLHRARLELAEELEESWERELIRVEREQPTPAKSMSFAATQTENLSKTRKIELVRSMIEGIKDPESAVETLKVDWPDEVYQRARVKVANPVASTEDMAVILLKTGEDTKGYLARTCGAAFPELFVSEEESLGRRNKKESVFLCGMDSLTKEDEICRGLAQYCKIKEDLVQVVKITENQGNETSSAIVTLPLGKMEETE